MQTLLDRNQGCDLAMLVDGDPHVHGLWGPEDWGDMLRHRLELAVFPESADAGGSGVATGVSVGHLLGQERPDVGALRQVAEMAKKGSSDPEHPLPPEVAAVLFFAAHAAGLKADYKRISDIDDSILSDGLEWVSNAEFVNARLRELCRSEAKRMGGKPAGTTIPSEPPRPFAQPPDRPGLTPGMASALLDQVTRTTIRVDEKD